MGSGQFDGADGVKENKLLSAVLILYQKGFVVKVQQSVAALEAVDEEECELLAGVDQFVEMGFHIGIPPYLFKIMGCRVNPHGPEGISPKLRIVTGTQMCTRGSVSGDELRRDNQWGCIDHSLQEEAAQLSLRL